MTDAASPADVPNESMPARQRGASFRFLRGLLSVLAALATLELCSRLFDGSDPVLTQADEQVGVRYLPSLAMDVYDPESCKTIPFRTSRMGFRGADAIVPKPPGTFRVLVLGDSYVAAHAVTEQDCLAGQLQQQLTERHGIERCEVLNFGVTGSCTGQELVLYERELRTLQADLVLVVFTSDDAMDNSAELSNKPILRYQLNDRNELELMPLAAARVHSSKWLNRTSRLYVWQKEKMNHLAKNLRAPLQSWGMTGEAPMEKLETVFLKPESEAIQHAWTLTERILERFDQVTQEDGATLRVVYLPSANELNRDHANRLQTLAGDQFVVDLQHPATRIASICRSIGVECIRLDDAFANQVAHGASLESLYFGGTGHLNVAGHAHAANALATQLEPQVAELARSAVRR